MNRPRERKINRETLREGKKRAAIRALIFLGLLVLLTGCQLARPDGEEIQSEDGYHTSTSGEGISDVHVAYHAKDTGEGPTRPRI